MSYQQFKQDFDEKFPEGIDEFIQEKYNHEWHKFLIQNDDEISHDSYGSEDSKLRRIYYFPDYSCYVEFTGTRCSYEGEEWDNMKEVFLKTKTINIYE